MNKIIVSLNGEETEVESGPVKAVDLYEKLEISPDNERLYLGRDDDIDVLLLPDDDVIVRASDSYFTIPAGDDDAIDLEICARADRRPPKGQKQYKIKIDGDKYTVGSQKITGTEILAQAGKNYEDWTLNQKLRGGRRKLIEEDEEVDLALPGLERFETVSKQAQQGGRRGQCRI